VSWHSLHIHYYTSPDHLLVESIAPLVASCRAGRLSRWFFLRYWKRGPHLRLRFLLDEAAEEATLRAVQEEIGEYLARRPSTAELPEVLKDSLRTLARLEGDNEQEYEIAPDNTIWLHPYEPEYNRYGGKLGVALAEGLFEASSDIALDVLGIINEAPARRLGISFVMMLAGLRGAGMSEESIADFLVAYYRFWSRYLPDDIAAAWSDGLEEKQRSLLPRAAAVLSDSSPNGSQVGDALARWRSAVGDVVAVVDKQADDILPEVIMPVQNVPIAHRRDFLLLNYLHTHNNRLGVVPAHEAYLAYLAHQVVCRLAGFAPKLETRPDSNPLEARTTSTT
jgi:thiopeptide-type bacteriocin biosynthesis protein